MTKRKNNENANNVTTQKEQVKIKEKEKFLLIPLFALQGMIDNPLGLARATQIGIFYTGMKMANSEEQNIQFDCMDKLAKDCLDSLSYKRHINYIYTEGFFEKALDWTREILRERGLLTCDYPETFEAITSDLWRQVNSQIYYEDLCLWYLMHEYFPKNCTPWKLHKEASEYCKAQGYDEPDQKNTFCLVNLKIMQNLLINHESYAGDEVKQREYRARVAMYLGCASIVGSSVFKATTSDMIKCRMFGAINQDELQELIAREDVREETYDFFTTRRRYDKLLSDLQLSKLVGECPWKRRTFISLRMPDSEKLQQTVINKSKERQRKDLNERKAALREKAKAQTIV